ncbi:MAG: sodium:proton antiporter [Oscillospiraceae bacterium]|nr:sodium:proton antiporter [Oscillospiraceae bacterium]
MRTFLTGAMIFIAVLIAAMLLRAFLGPRYTDRLVAVNLISTLGLCEVFLLVVLTRESFLLDIALIYALVSFVTTTVLSRIIVRREERSRRQRAAAKKLEDEEEV